jgi:hypothetical protein
MVMPRFSVILHHNRASPEVSFAPKSLPCLLFALLQQALIIDRLWEQSQQGKLTYVTQSEFDAYYSNTICGVGIWVSEPRQWKHPLGLFELREILGKR